MLRDTEASVVSVAAALGYASQTAFAAAFKKLTAKRLRATGAGAYDEQQSLYSFPSIALGQR